ncbi:MAG: putative lipid II flippase FtsW [Ruminiclostridium sp.]|nr:putative lipid II flippase FtsW [Ruminiclostridium sp.]
MKEKKPFDFWLFMTVLIMLSFGLVILFSASAPWSQKDYGDIYYVIKSQLIFAAIGIVAMLFSANIDYHKYGKLFVHLFIAGNIFTLILVFIPGIGREVNGQWRQIFIGGFNFQPSELAKLGLILFLSYSLSKRKKDMDSFFKDFTPYLILIGVFAGLLLMETHLSATIIICSVAFIVLFAGGAKLRHFMIIGIPALAGLMAFITFTDYMTSRIRAFIDPWSDLQGEGWQTVQSLYAIGSGGIFGRGLGQSMQKFLWLPEAQNDYIFAVLAEELGFIGVLAVLILFLIFIWRGIKIAINAPDVYGSLVAVGITSLIAVQSLFNVAVVTKSVPPTGVSLPFFSSGGTSLVLFLVEVGILLNISRYSNYERI